MTDKKNKVSSMVEPDWFAVNRSLLKSDGWLSEPFTKSQAWIDIIGLARWKDGFAVIRGIEVPLKRGQHCRSELKLAERWSWSRGKVNRFLTALETKQQIIQQKTNVTTITTVVNYDRYQPRDTTDNTPNSTPNSTADGHQTEQQTDTKEEGYKEKHVQSTTSCAEPVPSSPPEDSVLTFECIGDVKEWHLTKSKIDEWSESYDGVDVFAECRKARQWTIDNKSKRKTASGMNRFLGSWISRAVNSGKATMSRTQREEDIDVVL